MPFYHIYMVLFQSFVEKKNYHIYKLSKKKITKKHISPDIPAAKVLLEHFSSLEQSKYENMTEQELMQEKINLIKLLQKEGDNES